MSDATYADALKELAPTRPVKRAIGDAARLAGMTYTRAFDIWYGKARRIDAHEAAQITEAIEKKREEEARNEYHDLRTRFLKMESWMAAQGKDDRRAAADPLRLQTRGPSGVGSPMGRGR